MKINNIPPQIFKYKFFHNGLAMIGLAIGMIFFIYIDDVHADVNYFFYNAPNRGVVQLVNSDLPQFSGRLVKIT